MATTFRRMSSSHRFRQSSSTNPLCGRHVIALTFDRTQEARASFRRAVGKGPSLYPRLTDGDLKLGSVPSVRGELFSFKLSSKSCPPRTASEKRKVERFPIRRVAHLRGLQPLSGEPRGCNQPRTPCVLGFAVAPLRRRQSPAATDSLCGGMARRAPSPLLSGAPGRFFSKQKADRRSRVSLGAATVAAHKRKAPPVPVITPSRMKGHEREERRHCISM